MMKELPLFQFPLNTARAYTGEAVLERIIESNHGHGFTWVWGLLSFYPSFLKDQFKSPLITC